MSRKLSQKAMNQIRIIGGDWKRTPLPVLDAEGLRPTPNRVRETLFNWLGQRLDGWVCLDLFAGSGALGFEAASRGAKRVVMVEKDPVAFAALERFRTLVGMTRVELVHDDALLYLAAAQDRFDVVFLDPPFRQNALGPALEALPARLAAGARVYVEAPAPLAADEEWRELKRARAGQVSYQLLEKR